MNRLAAAMIAYVGLAVLVWLTITDTKLRAGTLLILGLFAVKSWTRRKDVLHPDGEHDARQGEELKVDRDCEQGLAEEFGKGAASAVPLRVANEERV